MAAYWTVARVEDDLFQVVCYSPLRIPTGSRRDIAETIVGANHRLRVGKFELDLDDGELFFQVSPILDGDAVGEAVIDRMIGTAVNVLNTYTPYPAEVVNCLNTAWERAGNVATLEGTLQHKRADSGKLEHSPTGRVARAVLLRCARLRLVGKADVVEFHRQDDGHEVPFPVEYKRGRRRKWDNDDVQLYTQALCLEEMLGANVPAGAVFHVKSERGRDVTFTTELRTKTEAAALRLHELTATGVTPPPILRPRCRGCSLREFCLPELLPDHARLKTYQSQLYAANENDL